MLMEPTMKCVHCGEKFNEYCGNMLNGVCSICSDIHAEDVELNEQLQYEEEMEASRQT